MEYTDLLARLNAHPRNKRITFDPIRHTYTINGDPTVKYTYVNTCYEDGETGKKSRKIVNNYLQYL